MKMTTGKKTMLAYSILFFALSISFVDNDITNKYNWLYIIWMALGYLLLNIGNFFYTFEKRIRQIQTLWKVLFPVFIINLVVSIIIDQKYGSHASENYSVSVYIIAAILVFVILFPSFRANFKWAYNK